MEFEKLEKMAFKNKIELSKLDKQDLLAIIEFLQLDRKSWLDQFTKTHNESIDIAKQNQKYKETIDKAMSKLGRYADELTGNGNAYAVCVDLLDILKEVE